MPVDFTKLTDNALKVKFIRYDKMIGSGCYEMDDLIAYDLLIKELRKREIRLVKR